MTESAGNLLREDAEKAKVLTVTFTSVVTSKNILQEPYISEHRKLPQVPEWLRSLQLERLKTQFDKILSRDTDTCSNFDYFEQRRLDFMITKDPFKPHPFFHPVSTKKWEGLP